MNRSLITTLSDEEKKEDTRYDDEDDTDPNERMTFNIVVDLKDISLHDADSCASNEESLDTDEEVTYEELQEKYNLMYTK